MVLVLYLSPVMVTIEDFAKDPSALALMEGLQQHLMAMQGLYQSSPSSTTASGSSTPTTPVQFPQLPFFFQHPLMQQMASAYGGLHGTPPTSMDVLSVPLQLLTPPSNPPPSPVVSNGMEGRPVHGTSTLPSSLLDILLQSAPPVVMGENRRTSGTTVAPTATNGVATLRRSMPTFMTTPRSNVLRPVPFCPHAKNANPSSTGAFISGAQHAAIPTPIFVPTTFVGTNEGGDQRASQRRLRSEYMQNQRSAETARTQVPTSEAGEVIGLKTIFHRAIRDIAGRVLDVSLVNFNDHPEISFELIDHDLQRQFTFKNPLREGYVRNYLKEALCQSRYQWRCFWKKHGKRHPQCPVKRYNALVAYWSTAEAEEESKKMRRVREARGGLFMGALDANGNGMESNGVDVSADEQADMAAHAEQAMDSDEEFEDDVDAEGPHDTDIDGGFAPKYTPNHARDASPPFNPAMASVVPQMWHFMDETQRTESGGRDEPFIPAVRTSESDVIASLQKEMAQLRLEVEENKREYREEFKYLTRETALSRKAIQMKWREAKVFRGELDQLLHVVSRLSISGAVEAGGPSHSLPLAPSPSSKSVDALLTAVAANKATGLPPPGLKVLPDGIETAFEKANGKTVVTDILSDSDSDMPDLEPPSPLPMKVTDPSALTSLPSSRNGRIQVDLVQMEVETEDYLMKTYVRKGKQPSTGSSKGVKRRNELEGPEVEGGFLVDFSEDLVAVTEAGKKLKQKQARQKKKPLRFGDVEPPKEIHPKHGQKPALLHKDVWILHPEHSGVVVGFGRSGVHWKTPKIQNPTNRVCELGMQMVHVQRVFVPEVEPMFASKQKKFKVLEDALQSNVVEDGWLKWGVDYLVEIR